MIELTEEQRRALRENGETPPRVVDPETNTSYVLLREEVYNRVKTLLDDTAPEAMYARLADLAPEDWEDPSVYGISCQPCLRRG